MRALRWWPYLLVALVAIAHRSALLVVYGGALRALAEANPSWYTAQQLPIPLLREQGWRAFLYLQQTPPIPNLLMAAIGVPLEWPAGVTLGLTVLQAAISLATALLLVHVVLLVFPGRRVLAGIVGVVFMLSTDVVVLEYNSLGQTYYENLTMLLALTVAWLLIRFARRPTDRGAVAIGLAVAALALTRASWSYFAPVAALWIALLKRGHRTRALALFALPVVVLHGGWALKNALVYGTTSVATSTWSGWNIANGIRAAGYGDALGDLIAATRGGDDPLTCFIIDWTLDAPADIETRDAEINDRLGGLNPKTNTGELRWAADRCGDLALRFCHDHPDLCLRKAGRAYQLFWQPAANYGRLYLALFATSNAIDNSFDLAGIVRLLAAGKLPEATYVVSGTYPRRSYAPAALYTLRWLDPAVLVANIVAVHVLVPILIGIWIVQWARGRRLGPSARWRRAALLIATSVYGYLALVGSAGEYGENMRFRLDVEPVIWLITLLAVAECWCAIRGRNGSLLERHRPVSPVDAPLRGA